MERRSRSKVGGAPSWLEPFRRRRHQRTVPKHRRYTPESGLSNNADCHLLNNMRTRDLFLTPECSTRVQSPELPTPTPNRIGCRRGSRISAREGRQGIDDLIWDGDEQFLTYANTYLQLFQMFIAILGTYLCLNGAEQPFQRHQCPFFLPLRRRRRTLESWDEPAPSARVPPS